MTDSAPASAPLSIVILAAGQGRRMGSDLPKVLQPLAGRALLQHVIDAARALAPERICVVYGHGGEIVQNAMTHENLEWAHQAQQLGTGHAVAQAIPLIPEHHTVLVLYGDVPLIRPTTLAKLVASARADSLALLTVKLADPTGYGRIVRDSAGSIAGIVEQKDASTEQLAIAEGNSGVMATDAKWLAQALKNLTTRNAQGEYYLTDVVAAAVTAGRTVIAVAAPTELEVLGVNDKLQLSQVEAGYRRMRAEELMRAGATLVDPARIDVNGTVTVGRDVTIGADVTFIGQVTLGSRVKIGPHCIIRDTQIADDTEILSHCVIEEAHIHDLCRIGPFARLRPGAKLEVGVHIGNFVEVKNSSIGAGSKVNHLSYIGDAQVGQSVNIGAGTITCNYDGANKWPTIIEDGVFVGSGSMLVAPVRVGAGATIGAGSTIARTAPAQKLTLTRAMQHTVASWERPTKASAEMRDETIAAALAPTTEGGAIAPIEQTPI